MELETWKNAVSIHLDSLESIIEDRKILKNSIEEHLKSCFEWDSIEYNKDFTKITLKWDRHSHPVIKHENIQDLGMDWIISTSYDDGAFSIVVVEVYPWGIEEDKVVLP